MGHVCKENTIVERNVLDLSFVYHLLKSILGDPGTDSRVDKMFVAKVFCKIETIDLTENFHLEHFIDPTNCPWVSEDG